MISEVCGYSRLRRSCSVGGFFALFGSWAGVIDTDSGIFVRPLHCLVNRICIELMNKIIKLVNGYMK
jgi:hypothetical protein